MSVKSHKLVITKICCFVINYLPKSKKLNSMSINTHFSSLIVSLMRIKNTDSIWLGVVDLAYDRNIDIIEQLTEW